MDKLTRKYHQAAQIRARKQRQAADATSTKQVKQAYDRGVAYGRYDSRNVVNIGFNDFELLRYAVERAAYQYGHRIADAMADHNSAPLIGQIAAEIAEQIWLGNIRYDDIKEYTRYRLERRSDVLAIDLELYIPAVTSKNRFTDEMLEDRRDRHGIRQLFYTGR